MSVHKTVKTDLPVAWRYESRRHQGVCALTGGPMHSTLYLCHRGGYVFPDVCEVERWLAERLMAPATAEGLACEAALRWGLEAEVVQFAPEHGPITARCPAPPAGVGPSALGGLSSLAPSPGEAVAP